MSVLMENAMSWKSSQNAEMNDKFCQLLLKYYAWETLLCSSSP